MAAPGPFPLVVYSHGNGGLRYVSAFLTEHLASHGFIVVAPDHVGNTAIDSFAGFTALAAVGTSASTPSAPARSIPCTTSSTIRVRFHSPDSRDPGPGGANRSLGLPLAEGATGLRTVDHEAPVRAASPGVARVGPTEHGAGALAPCERFRGRDPTMNL